MLLAGLRPIRCEQTNGCARTSKVAWDSRDDDVEQLQRFRRGAEQLRQTCLHGMWIEHHQSAELIRSSRASSCSATASPRSTSSDHHKFGLPRGPGLPISQKPARGQHTPAAIRPAGALLYDAVGEPVQDLTLRADENYPG